MTILILGSSGQIGSALCNYYRRHSIDYLTCDILDSPEFDLRESSELIKNLFSNASFVFFLAFDVGGSHYLSKFQGTPVFLENNMKIMLTSFRYLRCTGVPFIFASTQMSNMTNSPYGALKLLGEYYTRSIDGLSAQFWNTYGNEIDPCKTHVITDFLIQAKNYRKIVCGTDGTECRQFLHADDCAIALDIARLNTSKLSKKVIHITSHQWTPISEVAYTVSSIYDNCPVEFSNRTDMVQNSIKNEPGTSFLKLWKPSIDLKSGIIRVNDFICKHY